MHGPMSAPGLQAGDTPPPPFQNSGDTNTEGDAQGGYQPREGQLGAVTSGVPQGLTLEPVLSSAPVMAPVTGQRAPPTGLQPTQDWEEWLIHRMVVLPFRGTLKCWRNGQTGTSPS